MTVCLSVCLYVSLSVSLSIRKAFAEKLKAVEGRPFVFLCPVGGFPIQEVIWKKGKLS
jgi:hypothetical protein